MKTLASLRPFVSGRNEPTTSKTSRLNCRHHLRRALGFAAVVWAAACLPSARAQIYVLDGNLNGGNGGVSVFAPSATGNVLPDMTLMGASTTLNNVKGVVANSSNVFVLCNTFASPPFIIKFSLPTSGNAAPVSTTYLAPSSGSYGSATALAIDGTNLYVLDNGTGVSPALGAVNVYPLSSLTSNTSGSPLAATRTITGVTNTGFNRPSGLAVDSTSIYVANAVGNNLLIFALAASGDVAPTATITGLNSPQAVAVDATRIYVLNNGSATVTTYPVGTSGGGLAATTTLGSTSFTTGMTYLAVDATSVYVGDTGDIAGTPVPSVFAFPKTTNNTSATPSTSIAGTTALTAIGSLWVLAPPGTAAPTVTTSSGSAGFTVGGSAAAVDSGVTLTAVPSTLGTATIQITTGLQSAQDVLAFTNTSASTFGNIAGTYNVTLATLRLVSDGATATKAQWQAALRAVTYNNTSGSPTTGNRTVTFKVFDGAQTSSLATKTVAVGLASTTVAAAATSAPYSAVDQTVSLTTTVTSTTGIVNAGTVTFTVKNGGATVGTAVTSGTVTNGAASASYTLPGGTAPGTYTIQAVYSGGGSFAASSDSTQSLTVNALTTTTAASAASATYNPASQTVSLSATVSSGGGMVNTGTVTFTLKSGSTVLGSAVTSGTVANGAASASYTLPAGTAAGTYTIQAVYNAGGLFATSSDSTRSLTIAAAATTISTTSVSVMYSSTPWAVPLSATVTSSAGTVNAGSVTFIIRNGGTVLTQVTTSTPPTAGVATINVGFAGGTAAGTYTIVAIYNAGGSFAGSTDSTQTFTILPAVATTINTAAASTTYSSSGQTVSLSATVTSGGGTVNAGSVTFVVKNGSANLGAPITTNAPFTGTATVSYPLPAGAAAGTYTILTIYNAGGSFAGNTDSTQSLTILPASTTVSASAASATYSASTQTLSLSATVTSTAGTVNTGTVTFTVKSGSTLLGTAVTSGTVSNGVATASYTLPAGTAPGSYTIQAVYNAGGSFAASSDSTKSLTIGTPSTTIAATAASATYSTGDQTVPLTATVTSSGGTVNAGTVTFTLKSGSTTVGSAVTSGTVANGTATASYSVPGGTSAGTYTIQAVYNGAAPFSSSSDTTRVLTIDSAATTVTVSATPVVFSSSKQTVTITANVTSAAGTVNTGIISFTSIAATQIADVGNVVNGTVTITATLPAGIVAGSYPITALYVSSTGLNFGSSTASTSLVVGAAATTTAASGEFLLKGRVSILATGTGLGSLTADGAGNLYSGDWDEQGNGRILKITSSGTVSTFATGLGFTWGMVCDNTGNLQVASHHLAGDHNIYSITPKGVVSVVSPVVHVRGPMARDTAGNLYVTDYEDYYNHRINKVSSNGQTASAVASGLQDNVNAMAVDQAGSLYFASGFTVSKVTGGVVSTVATFGDKPSGLAFDTAGNLYVHDGSSIHKVTPSGTLSLYAYDAYLGISNYLTIDTTGNLYTASALGSMILKVTPFGVVNLTAKITSPAGTVNGGTVTFTLLNGSTVVGTPVTSDGVSAGTVSVAYPLPAGGATASSYTIKAVYNPGTSYTTSSDSTATLTPTVQQRLQIFFGGFNNTASASSMADGADRHARAAAATSSLAAVINPGGTTGKLVGYIASINAGFAVDIAIADDNTFSGQTKALTSSTGTGQTLTFSGKIVNGVMTGSVTELGLSFTANVDPNAGSSASSAGLYQASSLSAGGGTTYSIVGTQGQAFVLALTPSGVSAGMGTVSASGSYTVSTTQGASGTTIAGTVNTTTGTTSATITSAGGTTVSVTGVSAAVPITHRLANLSLLGSAGGGQNITAGFVVSGPKTVLARAIGPSLSQFGVTGVQATPTLTLFDGTGKPVVTNSGWAGDSTVAAAFSQVGAFNLAATSRDAAAIATLPAGAYTLQVTGGATGGRALAELYDLDPILSPLNGNLVNLSSLGPVAGTATVLTAGFVIDGNSPHRVLIRGLGPSLTQFGVTGALATPLLKLYDGTQTVIAQNQAWGTPVTVGTTYAPVTASAMVTAASSAGAFPLATGSNDSAVAVTLPPGSYTVQISGANNASGTALIEIYEIK